MGARFLEDLFKGFRFCVCVCVFDCFCDVEFSGLKLFPWFLWSI